VLSEVALWTRLGTWPWSLGAHGSAHGSAILVPGKWGQ